MAEKKEWIGGMKVLVCEDEASYMSCSIASNGQVINIGSRSGEALGQARRQEYRCRCSTLSAEHEQVAVCRDQAAQQQHQVIILQALRGESGLMMGADDCITKRSAPELVARGCLYRRIAMRQAKSTIEKIRQGFCLGPSVTLKRRQPLSWPYQFR